MAAHLQLCCYSDNFTVLICVFLSFVHCASPEEFFKISKWHVVVHSEVLLQSFCAYVLHATTGPTVNTVWRVRGKTIRSVLCNIVCNNCAQYDAHTYEQTNSSLDWVLSHWAHFTVLDSFLYCVLLCVVCMIA